MRYPTIDKVFADNGEFSHFKVIDGNTGETLWEDGEPKGSMETKCCEQMCRVDCDKVGEPRSKHHPDCPEYNKKKPQLFYYEDAVDTWCPAPEKIENIVSVEDSFEDGDKIEIEFKRVDMSDKEMDELPEV